MDRGTGLILVLIAIFLLWSLRAAPVEAAAFPGSLLIILIGLSSSLVIGKWKEKYSIENSKHVGIAALLMVAFILLLPVVGFVAATLIMFWVSMWLGGYRKPLYRPPILALLLTVCLYLLFITFLKVPLP